MSVPLPPTVPPPTPNAPKATIISEVTLPATDPARLGHFDTLITYQTDPLHRYTVRIASDHPTENEILAAIRNDYASRAHLAGKEIAL